MLWRDFKRNIFVLKLIVEFVIHYLKSDWAYIHLILFRIDGINTGFSVWFVKFVICRLPNKKIDLEKSKYFETVVRKSKDDQFWYAFYHNTIVLKAYVSENEKGVILVAYTDVVFIMFFLLNMDEIFKRYYLVVEPSTENACHLYYYFSKQYPNGIIHQYHSTRELDYLKRNGLRYIDLCAGDWIDDTIFKIRASQKEKKYDFCYVANFIDFKNHDFVFKALSSQKAFDLKFVLVATTYYGLSVDEMKKKLEKHGLADGCEIKTNLSAAEVSEIYHQSYCSLLCSDREGSNKASFEALLCGTPVLVKEGHIGFPYKKFKSSVFNYSNEAEFVEKIREIKTLSFDTSSFLETGSSIANQKLQKKLKYYFEEDGLSFTTELAKRVKVVHSKYKNPENYFDFISDYEYIKSCSKNHIFQFDLEYSKRLLSPQKS